MPRKVKQFDISDHLASPGVISAYLNTALQQEDSAFFMAALGDLIKAVGVAKIASDAGIGRTSIYKTFAPGSFPRFETVMKLTKALGVTLAIAPLN